MQDADKDIVESLGRARSGPDQAALNSVRFFLRQEGNVFLRRIDTLYRGYLERAYQTMYVDLRRDMRKLSIDELSLIDDEVVNHQIEVGRLTERMRDANEESIGRLNVIVARLHGDTDARERENPFRPYLLARALYEAIRETAGDEAKTRVLFQHLANALIQHLPGYYAAIREVFESSGVRGDFLAQRSRAAHNQRYFGAPPDTRSSGSANADAKVLPALERMLAAMTGQPVKETESAVPEKGVSTPELHEMIRKMLAPSKPFGAAAPAELTKNTAARYAASLNPLVVALARLQKEEAEKGVAPADSAPDAISLREQLNLQNASVAERMTVDVVSMLFEFILDDEQIPADLRRQLARMQIPLVKAAVLQPDMLQDDRHPARRLLNRMSTAGAGVDMDTPAGKALLGAVEHVIQKVLLEFDTDATVFSAALDQFESFLANHLRQDDKDTRRGIDAVEAAERFSVLLSNATDALCEAIMPLNVDKRVSDCVIQVWPHVLVHAALRDADKGLHHGHADSLYQRYHAVLPELVWSVQEKTDPQQRAALIRMLPTLVKRLRTALQMIQLPEEESKRIMDQMVEMHTAVLRSNGASGTGALPGLDDLAQQFSRVAIRWDKASWALDEPPQPRVSLIEELFAFRQIPADLNLGIQAVGASAAEREFLAQNYLLGTRVAFRSTSGDAVEGTLVWTSTHRSLYLFKRDDGRLALYTYASLLEALRGESVVPVEYAPVFERAVESLLYDAANMPAARA